MPISCSSSCVAGGIGMRQLNVNRTDQLHRDHVELIREQGTPTCFRIDGIQKICHACEMTRVRQGWFIQRKHVTIERVPEPLEHLSRGRRVAKYLGEGVLSVFPCQESGRQDRSIDQVLCKYGPSDQSLGMGRIQTIVRKVSLNCAKVVEQLTVDTVPAIDCGIVFPELARRHGKPPCQCIEPGQLLVYPQKGIQKVFGRVGSIAGAAESVVEANPVR